MSGPIIRSGASELFTQNWDSVFSKGSKGKKAADKKKGATAVKSAKPKAKKAAGKKKSGKKK